MKEMRWGIRKLLVLASINAHPATVRELAEQSYISTKYIAQMMKIVTDLRDSGYIKAVDIESREGPGKLARIYGVTPKGAMLIENIRRML